MTRLFAIAVVISLAPWLAQAAPPTDAPWVLLGLDVHMGAVTVRDTATVSVYGEGLRVYRHAAHLTDGEAAAPLKELNGLIHKYRCFLSDRIKARKAIRTKIRPEPARTPLPSPSKH